MEEKKKIDQVVGTSFEDLSTEDMKQVQGAGDVEAETAVIITPPFMPKGNGSNGNIATVITPVVV